MTAVNASRRGICSAALQSFGFPHGGSVAAPPEAEVLLYDHRKVLRKALFRKALQSEGFANGFAIVYDQ